MKDIERILVNLARESMRYTPKKEDGTEDYLLRNSLFGTTRGLTANDQEGDWEETYPIRLNLDVIDVLRKYFLRHEKESFVVIDMGCGSGTFLSQLEQGDKRIKAFGITNILFEADIPREQIIFGDYISDGRIAPYVLDKIPKLLRAKARRVTT